ncbi:hypothetical protein SynPROS71_00928 [Synechococcus sp. PROS-7-1]|nr:hypothetical protein SynPROS71_00928 [Synechococcus sp. PROS-7-1]
MHHLQHQLIGSRVKRRPLAALKRGPCRWCLPDGDQSGSRNGAPLSLVMPHGQRHSALTHLYYPIRTGVPAASPWLRVRPTHRSRRRSGCALP